MKDLQSKTEELTSKEKKIIDIAYSAIYFADNSDYRNAIWEIIKIVLDDDKLFEKLKTTEQRKLFKLFCDFD